MKKWLYVICPIVGIALFLALYFPAKARHEAGEAARAESIAKAKAADEAKKHEIEEKVRVDSQRRATENAREEAAKEAARIAKYNAVGEEIQKDTDAANADILKYTKQVDDLNTELDALRKRKEELTREDFDLLKQVELARVHQSNANLQIQRMVEMIANRAGASSLTVQIDPVIPKK